ncbi:RICIN domain-containing protein [Streptomyces sp. L2]|uniref:RICIN domain-containing protein n=1 Tax=Streptomyces sp. L2 TaxID=2162665 RepID=UPI0010111A6F|nr:RICIN domain-containing protein [Streptomyces sp. L2]
MARKAYNSLRIFFAASVALLLSLQFVGDASPATVTVTNGVQFTDTGGKVVHAHDGSMIKVGGYYYWFGENPYPNNHFRYISVYRSADLHAWEFRHNVLTEASAPELHAADASLWRPKVLYNARTKQYVMWMRKGSKPDANEAQKGRVAIAVSRTVDGDYAYRGSFRPLGIKSYDMTAFRDDDGKAYLISTTHDQTDLTIFRLTPDYLRVAGKVATLPGVKREGTAMFKRNGVYFLVASGVTGWFPNQAKYTTATSIAGPWSAMADYGDSIAYGSQSSSVLQVQGSTTTSYLYLGDRHARTWGPSLSASEYVWLPLRFPSRRSISLRWYPWVSIDTSTGVVRGIGGGHAYNVLRVRHSNMCLSVPGASNDNGTWVKQQTCGTAADPNQHWQLLRVAPDYYRLIVRHSHKCLTAPWRSTADGLPAAQQTCGTGTNQQWRFTRVAGGYFELSSRRSGKCLTIAGASMTNGARAVQATCERSANQQWRVAGAPY